MSTGYQWTEQYVNGQWVRVMPEKVDNLAAALLRASARTMGRPGHHKHCKGVHCTVHHIFHEQERFCLVQGFYKSSLWKSIMFCRACIDRLALLRDVGTVTVHEL